MHYEDGTQTLVQPLASADQLSPAQLEELASLKGGTVHGGKPVAQVALVLRHRDQADEVLPIVKRLGLECRALDASGEVIVLFSGSRVGSTVEALGGPILPVLREAGWPHVQATVHRALLEVGGPLGPWVTFGVDLGDRIARVPASLLAERSLADVEAEALRNLCDQPLEVRTLKPNLVTVLGEYGSEALLLPDVLRDVAARLGAELVAVGVPKEGGFLAHDATRGEEVSSLTAWSRQQFDEAECRRVSPLPLLVRDGRVVGHVAPWTEPGDPPSKPWWRFW